MFDCHWNCTGSDHCPVRSQLQVKVKPSLRTPFICTCNFKEFAGTEHFNQHFYPVGWLIGLCREAANNHQVCHSEADQCSSGTCPRSFTKDQAEQLAAILQECSFRQPRNLLPSVGWRSSGCCNESFRVKNVWKSCCCWCLEVCDERPISCSSVQGAFRTLRP